MKKALFVATVDSHIELFHLPFLKLLKEKGYEIHVATESDKDIDFCDKKIKIPIKRSPFKLISNYRAIKTLKKIITQENYSFIHCHTPVGGVVARLAGRRMRKNGLRIIYTAHGFHFYKGAPLSYWAIFYPVERYLAKHTDTLITINAEDYGRAKKKFGRRCHDIKYVHGVGIDENDHMAAKDQKQIEMTRRNIGIGKDSVVLTCLGRLDKNKNQGFLIKVLNKLNQDNKKYHLLLVGPDELNGKYQKLALRLGVQNNVHFLGFQDDIKPILQISDIVVSASRREGLPLSILEAIIWNKPVVATDNRGHRDIIDKDNGILVKEKTIEGFADAIKKAEITQFKGNLDKKWYLSSVIEEMKEIYEK